MPKQDGPRNDEIHYQKMNLQNIFAAFSCWFMAAGALMAWWAPQYLDGYLWQDNLGGIAAIEFLIVHSTIMITGLQFMYKERVTRVSHKLFLLAAILALAGCYLSLAYVVATEIGNSYLFTGFLILLISRATGFFDGIDLAAINRVVFRSALSGVLFFVGIFVMYVFSFPAGAVEGRLVGKVPMEGFLAATVMYFVLLGLFEYRVTPDSPILTENKQSKK